MMRRKHKARDYALAMEAMLLLGAARLLIAQAPFGRVMRQVRRRPGGMPVAEKGTAKVLQAIDRAARRTPFRAKCFEQALAGHWMLGRRGVATRLHYGIGVGGANKLTAHVWLSCGPDVILGEEGREAFAEVGSWPAVSASDRT